MKILIRVIPSCLSLLPVANLMVEEVVTEQKYGALCPASSSVLWLPSLPSPPPLPPVAHIPRNNNNITYQFPSQKKYNIKILWLSPRDLPFKGKVLSISFNFCLLSSEIKFLILIKQSVIENFPRTEHTPVHTFPEKIVLAFGMRKQNGKYLFRYFLSVLYLGKLIFRKLILMFIYHIQMLLQDGIFPTV